MIKLKFIWPISILFIFLFFPLYLLADNKGKQIPPTVDFQDNSSESVQNYQFIYEPILCRRAKIALKVLPENFDKESFEDLPGCVYFKDKNNVYYLIENFSRVNNHYLEQSLKIIKDADPKTFNTLPWKCDVNNIILAKDKRSVFINDKKMEGIDAITIKPLPWCFAKDFRMVYYLENNSLKKIDGVNVDSFAIISSQYAKDDKNIYYFGYSQSSNAWVVKLEDADISTFQVLENNKIDLTAKDKKNYYYKDRKISLPLRMLARLHRFQTRIIFNKIEESKFGIVIILMILISIGVLFLGYLIWAIKNKTWRQNFKLWLKNILIYVGIFLPFFIFIFFPVEDLSTGGSLYKYDIRQRFDLLIMALIGSIPFSLFLYLVKSRKLAILFSLLNLIILEVVFFVLTVLAGLAGA